jgi:prepilin-type N-terminal cleavage/methylation domain-containing protein
MSDMLKEKLLHNKKGFTLIEIVASVAILGIIAVAFFGVFTNGYTTVFKTGEKNNQMAIAASKMEELYTVNNVGLLDSAALNNLLGPTTLTTDSSLLYTYPADGSIRFFRTAVTPLSDVDGYTVTIVVFYENGQKNVSLSSFFKEKGVT